MADIKLPQDLQDEITKLNIEVSMCCVKAGIAVCKYLITHPEAMEYLPDDIKRSVNVINAPKA